MFDLCLGKDLNKRNLSYDIIKWNLVMRIFKYL